MHYPWPLTEANIVLDEALDIALDYLEFTRQAYPFSETQEVCAETILQSWRLGVRHRIRLANDAIMAIENRRAPLEGSLRSFYPRVS
jgi:hypothetical protein